MCGSLEPGCDGVGDYTRRLAAQLLRQGHQLAMVALNDACIESHYLGVQASDEKKIPVLRIPAQWSDKDRYETAKRWIDSFAPQWLSLQFVPFSFHPKGLPFGLNSRLKALGDKRQWHIMFHELWVGMDVQSPLKHMCWGMAQKWLIQDLLHQLKPRIIHTQSSLYQQLLLQLGYEACKLPLFGNITPLAEAAPLGADAKAHQKPGGFTFILFGGIHPGAPVREFAEEVAAYARRTGVAVNLTIIGRCGQEQEHWAGAWRTAGLSVELLGEQTPDVISKAMSSASMGISTTPMALLEKSSAVVAMLEHGLPVLCVSRKWQPRGVQQISPLSGTYEYSPGSLEKWISVRTSAAYAYKIIDVSHQMADKLLATV